MNAEILTELTDMEPIHFVNARTKTDATVTLIGRPEHDDVVVKIAGRVSGSTVSESFALQLNNLEAVGKAILANAGSSHNMQVKLGDKQWTTKITQAVVESDDSLDFTLTSGDGTTLSAKKKKKKKKKKGGGGGGGGGGLLGGIGRLFKEFASAVLGIVFSILDYFLSKMTSFFTGSSSVSASTNSDGGGTVTASGGCTKPPVPAV